MQILRCQDAWRLTFQTYLQFGNIGFLHEVLMNHICRLSRVNEKEQKMSRIKNLAEELYGEDWSEVLEDLENGGQDH